MGETPGWAGGVKPAPAVEVGTGKSGGRHQEGRNLSWRGDPPEESSPHVLHAAGWRRERSWWGWDPVLGVLGGCWRGGTSSSWRDPSSGTSIAGKNSAVVGGFMVGTSTMGNIHCGRTSMVGGPSLTGELPSWENLCHGGPPWVTPSFWGNLHHGETFIMGGPPGSVCACACAHCCEHTHVQAHVCSTHAPPHARPLLAGCPLSLWPPHTRLRDTTPPRASPGLSKFVL